MESRGCFGHELGEIHEWFTLEIYLFYVNLIVLLMYLVTIYFIPTLSLESRKESNKTIMDMIAKKYKFSSNIFFKSKSYPDLTAIRNS